MKKIYYLLLMLPLLALLGSCDKQEEIVFDHELPQFELKENAILLEVIMPQGTTAAEELYIAGAFNGGDEAVGKLEWRLEKAPNSDVKWGIYLLPSAFANGKTLADGFYFVSNKKGVERTVKNEDVMHTLNVGVGTRTNVMVARWESYFLPPTDGPVVPKDKIMLKLTVPGYTSANSVIALYGNVNGWNGSDAKWAATMSEDKPNVYYLLLDPKDFAGSLTTQFKFGLMVEGRDWWYHQGNEDGSEADGAGYTLPEEPVMGNTYSIEIKEWARRSDLTITLKLKVPAYTPANSLILLYGAPNGWNGSDASKWGARMDASDPTVYYMYINPKHLTGSFKEEFKFGLMVEGKEWWYHQSNDGKENSEVPGFMLSEEAVVGETYEIEILGWNHYPEILK